jgi:NAD(P)-dependent dehydrogenase (short-subunit alcohol dehydrogenase family)/acyl carrier protein
MTPLNQVVPILAPAASPAPVRDVPEVVLSVIAEVTRYPRDILLLEADLEEELGIDSVKRAEIFAVLRTRFDLPETTEAAPIELHTVGDVITAVQYYLSAAGPRPDAAAPAAAIAEPMTGPAGLQHRVVDVIAETTRYPRELLASGANLEDDLGFDRVQRSAILDAVRRQLGAVIPEAAAAGVRTVGDIVLLVTAPPSSAPAPASSSAVSGGPAAAGSARSQIHAAPSVAAKPFLGRVALVTGSGHGLGRTIARQLAGLGATVVINSFHSRQKGEETTQEIVAEGGKAVHLWGSVANPAQLESIFGEIGSQFGGLDFFISNASNGIFAPLADIRPEDWDKAFRTNVVALHQGALLAADLMRKQGGGKIVALSANASQRYVDYFGCMGPVKAAVECLVRYLAIELGSDNIQVNAVAAGPVLGDLLDKYPDLDRLRPKWEATVPRRRLNNEDEVAEAVTFLLTASGMNGSVLLVDAGGSQRITAGPR